MTHLPSPARVRALRLAGRAAALLTLIALTLAGAASSARADGAPDRPLQPPTTEPASVPASLQAPVTEAPALPPVEEAPMPVTPAVPAVAGVPVTVQIVPQATPDSVYTSVDEMPEMVGGMQAFAERLVYPEGARAEGAGGMVVVKFVVEATGAVTRVEVVRSSGDARLDATAAEAITAQPFTAGRLDGKAVAVSLVLPMRFALPADAPAER